MLIDGKKVRDEKIKELQEKVKLLERKLGFAVIQVGNDEASTIYIKQKEKMANLLEYKFVHKKYLEITEDNLIEEINKLNKDETIDGIIVQLPLPEGMDESRIINAIDPLKDVDGLSYVNSGILIHNKEGLISCTPKGIMDLLDYYHIAIPSKRVVIIGRSILVGKPLFMLLTNRNATVTLCHSYTKDLVVITKEADIIIVAVGKKDFLTKEMVKEGAVVIDVGINRVDGKLYGDACFADLKDKCSYITPVPGGVGPMTVYELGNNVYTAYKLRKNLKL